MLHLMTHEKLDESFELCRDHIGTHFFRKYVRLKKNSMNHASLAPYFLVKRSRADRCLHHFSRRNSYCVGLYENVCDWRNFPLQLPNRRFGQLVLAFISSNFSSHDIIDEFVLCFIFFTNLVRRQITPGVVRL